MNMNLWTETEILICKNRDKFMIFKTSIVNMRSLNK